MNIFGIDIGGTSVKWALVSEGEIADRGSIDTAFGNSDELLEALSALVEPYRGKIDGIGISAPGGILEDDPEGVIHRGGALTYMDGCPLGKLLRERFDVPVTVENDGKSCALGEYSKGALRGKKIGVVLAIGTGIGGGIVIDGRVLSGVNCFAGEFSFLNGNVSAGPALDTVFGGTGSWRMLAALVQQEKGMEFDPSVDGRKIFEWIEAGDADARRGLSRYCLMFDRWLFNLQAILDPEVFAIAGGISCHPELIDELRAQMPNAVEGYAQIACDFPVPKVVRAELGNDANIYGAVLKCERLIEKARA